MNSLPQPNVLVREKETGRVEAFSDGVFAFAITVLVLGLNVPGPENARSGSLLFRLLSQWPMFLAFLTSFGTILIMWINHHRLFMLIRHGSHGLLIFNGLLLGVSLVPFSTALVATYVGSADEKLAAIVYSGLFAMVSVLYNLLWWYAVSRKLLDDLADSSARRRITRQYLVGPVAYGIATGLAFLSVPLCLALNLLLAIYFALPNAALNSMLGVVAETDT